MVRRRNAVRPKKRIEPAETQAGQEQGLRGVYVSFFKAWGRLPDEIGRQKPANLFFILLQSGEDEPTEINPAVRDLYGM